MQNPQWRSKAKKDPGIPNLFPFKDKILAEIEEKKRSKEEEQAKRREEARARKIEKKKAGAADGAEEMEDDEDEMFDLEEDDDDAMNEVRRDGGKRLRIWLTIHPGRCQPHGCPDCICQSPRSRV